MYSVYRRSIATEETNDKPEKQFKTVKDQKAKDYTNNEMWPATL